MRQVASSEEERFAATLRQGLVLFDEAKDRAEDGRITGDDAFKLSDTFGFPLQLTEELAAEAGLSVDADRFAELLDEQRARARAAAKKVPIGLDAGAAPPSTFVGYEHLDADGTIVSLLDPEFRELEGAEEGEEVRVFLDRTPFYAEGGGQVGDRGSDPHAVGRHPGDRHRARGRSFDRPHRCRRVGRGPAPEQEAHPRSTPSAARRPLVRTPRPTSSTRRSASCSVSTLARRGRSSSPADCASTSRIPPPSRRSSCRRRS